MQENLNQSLPSFETQISSSTPVNIFQELEEELCVPQPKKEEKPTKKFMLYSSNGEYIEAKDAQQIAFFIAGEFYVHRPIKGGDGYVVSEGTTGLRIEEGATIEAAIHNAEIKVKTFVHKHGKEAFFELLRKALPQQAAPEPEPVVKQEPEIPIAVKQELPSDQVDINAAIDASLNHMNVIDLDYIAELTGKSTDHIEHMLEVEQLGFINPETNLWECTDDYLSGNIRYKLDAAEKAAAIDPRFEYNVERLKEVIPDIIPSSLIQYSLGAAWIPIKIFEAFATHLFKVKITVQYLPSSGKFFVKNYGGQDTIQIRNTYAAGGKNALDIMNAAMNNHQIIVTTPKIVDGKRVLAKDPDKTAAVQAMQEQMQDEFQSYIRMNKEFEQETELIYNEQFNSYVHRNFRTPTITHYPGASTHFYLREHQKKAVLRAMGESALFAHCVGSGKTAIIITTAMELRRLNKAQKPLIVVQNKTRGQFISTFRDIYPDANILAPTDDELSAAGRVDLYHRIKDEDWDAIIIPQSQFTMIPDDIDRQVEELKKQISAAEQILFKTNKYTMPFEHAQVKRTVKSLQKELDRLHISDRDFKRARKYAAELNGGKELLNFEDMGIDALLIDEFHFFKRLGFSTQMTNIKGIDTSKSDRSQSALLKIRWVQAMNEGRNVLVYTGTPISNTMAEAWTMIRYVRPDILAEIGITHFDQFAKTFGQVIPSLEQTGGGTFKIQNRFAKFQNLPEFITAFRACTDVVDNDDIKEFQNTDTIPKLKGGQIKQLVIKQSPELKEQIAEFRKTLEWYELLEGAERRQFCYIPLVIFNKAKQASIDLRLLNPMNKDCPDSKVNQVIREAMKIYIETGEVQMLFSDLYQSPEPKEKFLDEDGLVPNPAYGMPRFNLFLDIKQKLVRYGVPDREIAILTEPKYNKTERLLQLFDEANAGKVKWLLGTTSRMGVGVNAQRRLISLFHIDAPPRPMDFEQRNGRILRQGNLHKEVGVYACGVEKTLDSAAYQRLAVKQRFINQIMKGVNVERVMEDAADESQMTFDEMMAHLSDSPYAMQKLLVDNRLKSEKVKKDNFYAKQAQTEQQLRYVTWDLEKLEVDYHESKRLSDIALSYFPENVITRVIVKDQEYTEEMVIAVDHYIQALIEAAELSPTLTAIGRVFVNDVSVTLKVEHIEKISRKTHNPYNVPVLSFVAPEIGLNENAYGNGYRTGSNTGFSFMSCLEMRIQNIIKEPRSSKEKIDRFQVTAAELKRNLEAKFDETKLRALEEEIEVLTAKMMEDKNTDVVEELA